MRTKPRSDNRLKLWEITLLLLLLAVLVGGTLAHRTQSGLAERVIRLHVLANSDSEEDQALKLQVRDGVLAWAEELLGGVEERKVAEAMLAENLPALQCVAAEIIAKKGYGYPVSVELADTEFPTKEYDGLTLPAGEYLALRVIIGEGAGQNWWCVLYPNLCFVDAIHAVVPEEGKKDLKRVLDEEEYEMVTATSKFKIRWFFFK